MGMTHILAVDDDATVLHSVRRVLEKAGFTVTVASNGREALALIARQRPDLVVLDIIMPEMDGLEVCRRIRADPFIARLPILFLTSRAGPTISRKGWMLAATTLTKPLRWSELPARVRACSPGAGALDVEAEHLIVGELKLHSIRSEVHVGDRLVNLTSVEHQLLHYLMQHPAQPVAAEQLLEDVWQYPKGTGDPILVRVHIANLRAKIEPEPDTPRYIRNVRGRGYMLTG